MLARILLVLAVLLCPSARGQVPSIGYLASGSQYARPWGFETSCQPRRLTRQQRHQPIRIECGQRQRQAELWRRQEARQRLPQPVSDEEQLAASKFKLAHLLWQDGKAEASRRVLYEIPVAYPNTQAAERARDVLDRF